LTHVDAQIEITVNAADGRLEEILDLHELKAGESRTFDLEFGAITTDAELENVKKAIGEVDTKIVETYKQFVKKPV